MQYKISNNELKRCISMALTEEENKITNAYRAKPYEEYMVTKHEKAGEGVDPEKTLIYDWMRNEINKIDNETQEEFEKDQKRHETGSGIKKFIYNTYDDIYRETVSLYIGHWTTGLCYFGDLSREKNIDSDELVNDKDYDALKSRYSAIERVETLFWCRVCKPYDSDINNTIDLLTRYGRMAYLIESVDTEYFANIFNQVIEGTRKDKRDIIENTILANKDYWIEKKLALYIYENLTYEFRGKEGYNPRELARDLFELERKVKGACVRIIAITSAPNIFQYCDYLTMLKEEKMNLEKNEEVYIEAVNEYLEFRPKLLNIFKNMTRTPENSVEIETDIELTTLKMVKKNEHDTDMQILMIPYMVQRIDRSIIEMIRMTEIFRIILHENKKLLDMYMETANWGR